VAFTLQHDESKERAPIDESYNGSKNAEGG